jgi:peptidoglycan DL-endopeptidase CwlO
VLLSRLGSVAPRLRTAAPVALTVAIVLTAATGASAVTARNDPARPAAAPRPVTPAPTHLALPAPPAPADAAPAASASRVHEVAASATRVARVARPKHLVEATLLVTARSPLRPRQLSELRRVAGVHRTLAVSVGDAVVDGHHARVLGATPAQLRPWTPKLTAASQPLWQSIARGELTASFDMGHQARLPLGQTVMVRSHYRVPIRLGAFASVGMSGIDAVVSSRRADELGLARHTGIVISAPHADPLTLKRSVSSLLGPHEHAWLLRQMVVVRDSGEFLTRDQINAVLQTAAHEVGKPYVWGAEGPNSFDCSGLVRWSFAAAGIRMPRVSQQQWFAGPHVNYSDARPGDLLFWHYDPTDPGDIDHVAIYAGNGMMLVAPHTGAFVEYVPVPLTNMAGVVRVDPAMSAAIG